MTRTSRIAPWVPAFLLLGACASTPRLPPHAETSRFGVVHAHDPATAREHARILDQVGPVVARAVPGLDVEPVDLRVVGGISDIYRSKTQHCEFAGATFESGSRKWIELRSDLEPEPRRAVMAHELVHRWLGPAWKALPPAFEDGLCDVIGDAVRAPETPHERMRSFVACWLTLNGAMSVDQNGALVDLDDAPFAITFRADIEPLAPAEILDCMGRDLVGYHSIPDPRRFAVVTVLSRRVMSRISVDELFVLCRQAEEEGLARVPARRIFAAARMDPLDLQDWNDLLLETYGIEEQAALREEVDMPWELGKPRGLEGVSIRLQASVEF